MNLRDLTPFATLATEPRVVIARTGEQICLAADAGTAAAIVESINQSKLDWDLVIQSLNRSDFRRLLELVGEWEAAKCARVPVPEKKP